MIRPGAFFGTNDNAIVNQISEGSGQYLTSLTISRGNIKANSLSSVSWRILHCYMVYSLLASVSVLFRRNEGPRNGILGFGRTRNEVRAKK